jgi:hypothetical protein
MLLALALAAAVDLAPGTQYDPHIPTLKQVAGHDFGEQSSSPDEIAAYLQALAAAAPERARVFEYARSWEGRPLHVIAIAGAERMARLDEIQAGLKRLADPRGLTPSEAERLVADLPTVTWLLHSVHGNEISSSDAALAEAYHLLAAQGEADVARILAESIVLIDPLQNPDGRARFLAQNRLGQAAVPDPEPYSAEHDEPWPGGRSNHYLFDMNRDWMALTQPETVGRTRLFRVWVPQTVVDLHEMGGDSTYYFAPPADPVHPYITQAQRRWLDTFGRANAARFDERGFAYFIREQFDSFYPGYGESWPLFNGAVGMTFEQASSRGLVYRRQDETLLNYRTAVAQHFTAALRTALTAAENREGLLRDFVDYRRTTLQEGERGAVREYLIVPGSDPSRAERLARLLVEHGIEVQRADEVLRLGTRSLPAGTFVVPAAQPGGRLARIFLEPHFDQDAAFVKEQDRRRKKRLPDEIYDLTAWSLPLLYDVECVPAATPTTGRRSPLAPVSGPPASLAPSAKVAYLIPWGSGAVSAVGEALRSGLRAQSALEPFTLAGRRFGVGTAVLRVADNPADLRERLAAIAGRHGVEVVATDSGWVDEGISLGSNRMVPLRAPRVLLAWDAPTFSQSAGWTRWLLERRFGQPVTAVRVASLRRVDWKRFDVLVLPAGNYTPQLGEDVLGTIKAWVRDGGTLVTLGEASRWAAREKTALLETRTLLRDGSPEVEPDKDDKKKPEAKKPEAGKPFDIEQAIQPERERPESTPGALLRVTLDTEHWLAAGSDGEVTALVEGPRVFAPITLDKGRNAGVYATKDRLVAAGLVWDEARDLLAQRAFLIEQPMGSGRIVAFAEDPNFRGFTEATSLLFMNAVLIGPALR